MVIDVIGVEPNSHEYATASRKRNINLSDDRPNKKTTMDVTDRQPDDMRTKKRTVFRTAKRSETICEVYHREKCNGD